MFLYFMQNRKLDKLFAICDYHHVKDYSRKSRHIYMIYQSGLLDKRDLTSLIGQIIETRRNGNKTYSCQTGYRLMHVLQEIINDVVFKEDYETNTREFLSEYVDYQTCINSLQEIITKSWIPDEIPEDPAGLIENDMYKSSEIFRCF